MSRVMLDLSMSLDGFIAAANQRPEEPLGGAANDSTIGRSPATTTATARSSPAGWRAQRQ
jgi:hypothetical protein